MERNPRGGGDLEEVSVSFALCLHGGRERERGHAREERSGKEARFETRSRKWTPLPSPQLSPLPVSRNCWINNCGTEQKNREHRV